MLSGCSFFTLSERWISEIHVGLGGTAGVLFVRQLAEKRHRGLPGRIEASESGGGLTFGYNVVRTQKLDGTLEVGGRRINKAKAIVVCRISRPMRRGPCALDQVFVDCSCRRWDRERV